MLSYHPADMGNSTGAVECIYWVAGACFFMAEELGFLGASGAPRFSLAVDVGLDRLA